MHRRKFLRRITTALAAPYVINGAALGANGATPASDRICMACIGVGGRGRANMGSFLRNQKVRVLAVCDVFEDRVASAKAQVDAHYRNQDCATAIDFRELLLRDDIDAVSIGTPDHWHAVMTVAACKQGKDVYCEKPLSLTVREGRAMVQAARRYGRIVSGGSQRVWGDFSRLTTALRSGVIGKPQGAYVNVGGTSRDCYLPSQPIPPGLHWDLWLGPAPDAPYHPFRCGGGYGLGGRGFRTWRDYSGGMMTDWGGHKFGAALFGLELHHTAPVEVIHPDEAEKKLLTYRFANGMEIYHGGTDVTYFGEEGELGKNNLPPTFPAVQVPGNPTGDVHGDFIDCVYSRQLPFRDVEASHRTATVCHLGNICYWLGRSLKFDPESEQIVGDPEANRWLDRPRRGPWRL